MADAADNLGEVAEESEAAAADVVAINPTNLRAFLIKSGQQHFIIPFDHFCFPL